MSKELQEPERAEPGPTQQQKDEASDLEENLSSGEELRDEELLALTDKDQLKVLYIQTYLGIVDLHKRRK